MNQQKCTELRRKAHNDWVKLKPEYQKIISVRKIYQQLKKEYKKC